MLEKYHIKCTSKKKKQKMIEKIQTICDSTNRRQPHKKNTLLTNKTLQSNIFPSLTSPYTSLELSTYEVHLHIVP